MWMAITVQYILIPAELNIFQKKLNKFIGNKNGIANVYRIQEYDSIMCGYFYIGFIDLIVKVCLIVQIYFFLMITRRMIK